jgi:hypothetical protein
LYTYPFQSRCWTYLYIGGTSLPSELYWIRYTIELHLYYFSFQLLRIQHSLVEWYL